MHIVLMAAFQISAYVPMGGAHTGLDTADGGGRRSPWSATSRSYLVLRSTVANAIVLPSILQR